MIIRFAQIITLYGRMITRSARIVLTQMKRRIILIIGAEMGCGANSACSRCEASSLRTSLWTLLYRGPRKLQILGVYRERDTSLSEASENAQGIALEKRITLFGNDAL